MEPKNFICKYCNKNTYFESDLHKKDSKSNDCKLHMVTEDIFALFCPPTQTHEAQLQNAFTSQERIKENYPHSQVKIVSVSDVCSELLKLFQKSFITRCQLELPPNLKILFTFSEAIFDWLAERDENIVLIFCNESMEQLVFMVFCYSKFYDSLIKRNLKKSCSIKTFINCNLKYLQNVPVSFRRYASYLSQYSSNYQLRSMSSAVHLFCMVLHSFPDMHSNADKTSELFFKIYTDYPIKCCHTTNTYSLSSSINRLVILFDQYPVSLHDDVMIVCYHKYPMAGRCKIFRLNFHCCQANDDLLTFLRSDMEDVYDVCPLKMKLDLYFRATAVFEDEIVKNSNEKMNLNLSPIQKFDSYGDFRAFKFEENCQLKNMPDFETSIKLRIDSNKENKINEDKNKVVVTSILKSNVSNYQKSKTLENDLDLSFLHKSKVNAIINQSGQITGPVDTHHSSKVDTIRTSTTVLNTNNNNNMSSDNLRSPSYNVNKCSEQLDNLMADINTNNQQNRISVNTKDSPANTYRYKSLNNVNRQNSTITAITPSQNSTQNNRELELMNELLEAQREITNLRRSYNQLDTIDNSSTQNRFRNTTATTNNNNINNQTDFNRFAAKAPPYTTTMRSLNTNTNNRETFTSSTKLTKKPLSGVNNTHSNNSPIMNNNRMAFESSSTTYLADKIHPMNTGYSAHRENLQMQKQLSVNSRNASMERNTTLQSTNGQSSETTDVLEEIETINLQPIGKGIQDLTLSGRNSRAGTPVGPSLHQQYQHDNISIATNTMSPSLSRQNYNWNKSDQSNSMLRQPMGSMRSGLLSPVLGGHISSNNNTMNIPKTNIITQHSVDGKVNLWYRPTIGREEAILLLKSSHPGSFIIRDSNTYAGAYGLAVKVATIPPNVTPRTDDIEAEKVRHYLIEQVGSQGVCFKGFPDEPIFPNLSSLVLYYTRNTGVLPCLLSLPENGVLESSPAQSHMAHCKSQNYNDHNMAITNNHPAPNGHSLFSKTSEIMSHQNNLTSSNNNILGNQPKLGYSVYYLGCYDVEFITGPSVINKAVERLLGDLDNRRFTECQLLIQQGDGVVLTDMERKLFFRRHHPFSTISFCGLDPKDRKIELELCKTRGIKKTKVFGIIIKNFTADESKCFLFGELDTHCKSSAIVQLINNSLVQSRIK